MFATLWEKTLIWSWRHYGFLFSVWELYAHVGHRQTQWLSCGHEYAVFDVQQHVLGATLFVHGFGKFYATHQVSFGKPTRKVGETLIMQMIQFNSPLGNCLKKTWTHFTNVAWVHNRIKKAFSNSIYHSNSIKSEFCTCHNYSAHETELIEAWWRHIAS